MSLCLHPSERRCPHQFDVEDDEEHFVRNCIANGLSLRSPHHLGHGYYLGYTVNVVNTELRWILRFRQSAIGGGYFLHTDRCTFTERGVGLVEGHRGKGLYLKVLTTLIAAHPALLLRSDDTRTSACNSVWMKVPGYTYDEGRDQWLPVQKVPRE